MNRMRETRDQFMAPKMGLINETEDDMMDGTFKEYRGAGVVKQYGIGGGDAFKMPNEIRRYDSLLDANSLALD